MSAVFRRALISNACLEGSSLLWCSVPKSVCLFLILATMFNVFAKDIRLRNELIKTPDKPAAAMRAQGVENPVDGLYLIQFEGPITDEQRAQLGPLKVELLNSIPEDAFVAKFNGAKVGTVKALPFVRFVGQFRAEHKIHQKVQKAEGKRAVALLLSPKAKLQEAVSLHRRVPGLIVGTKTSQGTILRATVDADQLNILADSPAVLWIEPAPNPKLYDEIAAEIVAGELEGPSTFVHELGFDGEGVTVAVADSGLMDGVVETMHPDLAGRVDGFFHYGNLQDASDEHSHGTHVAGIVAGNGATGETDELGYLFGLGIAPKAHIVAQRIFDGAGGYEPPQTFGEMTTDAMNAGAVIGSNSWGDDTQGRYDLSAAEFDALVRDGDKDTPGDQGYILEFSAGNAGPGESTIGSPAVGKNVIATGASENNRFDFIIYAEGQDAMADFSSRGPCEDGRIKPDIVAPGTWIASLQSSSATDESAWLPISPNYQYQGGTSQAGPQVSGAAAVFVQFYRETHNGAAPSPALVKAALINSAFDMDPGFGTRSIPNNDEGWGRVDLVELIGSERTYEFIDQTKLLTQNQQFEKTIFVSDGGMPLRVTLTYTDVPGNPMTIPALVNNLDLEVVGPEGFIYGGNQFLDGQSVPGTPGRDDLNNVEAVYINNPVPGEYTIRVKAIRVPQDARTDTAATDQDFALVISGSLPEAGHASMSMDRRAYTAPSVINLKLVDFDLAGQATATVNVTSTSDTTPVSVTMRASGNIGVFTGAVTIATGPAAADQLLQIKHGDQIVATYQDTSPAETVQAIRVADLLAPVITDVTSTNRFGGERIRWTTDEDANAIVRLGTNAASRNISVTNNIFRTDHSVTLTNLIPDQVYNYIVISYDYAGNASTNNNGGLGFTFRARAPATVLLVNAYQHSSTEESPEIPVTTYTDALDQTGISYEVWNLATDGDPTLDDLMRFRAVIWRLNDSFWEFFFGEPSAVNLSPAHQTLLQNYIKRDGSLFIASMELLSRLGDVPFRKNVLQVANYSLKPDQFSPCPTCDEDHGVRVLEGSSGDSIGSGVEVELNYADYPSEELLELGPDLSDTFTPTADALPIFLDLDSQRVTGMRWPTDLKNLGRVVFLGAPLDAIPMAGPAPNNRVSILKNILGFLVPGVNGVERISFDRAAYKIPDQARIDVADSDIAGTGRTTVRVFSDTTPTGINVELLETPRRGVFQGFITLVESAVVPKPGELRVADGDDLWAVYNDASANTSVEAIAEIDDVAPIISNRSIVVDYQSAVVTWSTDEPADSVVQFGESAFLTRTSYDFLRDFEHAIVLDGLKTDQIYYYQVVSKDLAGNTTIDDNNGQLYTFRTLKPKPAPWSENFETTTEFLSETFEGGELNWEWGTPANDLQTAGHSGTNVWGTNLRGISGIEYTETALASPAIDLTTAHSAKLKFWHSYDFTLDATYEAAGLFVVTNAQTTPVLVAQYGDLAASWEEEEIDLTPFIGKVVQFVWFYQLLEFEDPSTVHIGWMIDDVSVTVDNTVVTGTLKVQPNISQSTFTITGPSGGSGAGLSYTNANALPGQYTVTFAPVQYYTTPPAQTVTVAAGSTVTIEGKYQIADSNQNGMADAWEQQYFGANPPSDGSLDSDGDAASNYAEFIAGTEPNDPNSRFRFQSLGFVGSNLNLTWQTVSGRSYRILGSSDAVNWSEFIPWTRADSTFVTRTIPPLAPANVFFFKVEVRP
jgi:hypothetical protein